MPLPLRTKKVFKLTKFAIVRATLFRNLQETFTILHHRILKVKPLKKKTQWM